MPSRLEFAPPVKASEPMHSRVSKRETDNHALNPEWQSLALRIQPELKVNQAGDTYEEEADVVAGQILSAPGPPRVQRLCSECDEEEEIQKKDAAGPEMGPRPPAGDRRIEQAARSGRPLPPSVRAFFEPRFGADFSGPCPRGLLDPPAQR